MEEFDINAILSDIDDQDDYEGAVDEEEAWEEYVDALYREEIQRGGFA